MTAWRVTASNLPVWLCVSSGVGTLLVVGWFHGSLAAAAPAAFGAVCRSAIAGLAWRAAQRTVERARSASSGADDCTSRPRTPERAVERARSASSGD